MTQPFADALTWVPKSRALGATLGRAHDLARAQNHSDVTLEHVLLALIEDPDASSVLLSCNIDLLKLNASIAEYVQQQPAGPGDMPEAAPALRTILEYAVAAARQSRRNEINGAIVLAAIIGEGKSEAAKLLLAAGLKFQDTVAALKRSSAPSQPRPAPVEAAPAQPPPIPVQQSAPEVSKAGAPAVEHQAAAVVSSESPVAAAEAPASGGQYAFDDDPVTTARRRIAAIRSGQTPPPPSPIGGPHATVPQPMSNGNAAVAWSPEQLASAPPSVGSDWAPAPMPQAGIPAGRMVRMPPPVPPVADAPLRRIGIAPEPAPTSNAPWSDGAPAGPPSEPSLAAKPHGQPLPQAGRPPIETADLIESFPLKLPMMATTTIEVRIPRSAVLATASGSNVQPVQGRGPIVTRAVAVRLRAPAGGLSVENASPETQWFDSKSAQREDDDVRWRWAVTPRTRGRLPLQLSVSIRTVAADGMIVETMLPEQQVTVRVSGNPRAAAKTLAKWALAALIGGILTLLASVGVAGLLGRVFQ